MIRGATLPIDAYEVVGTGSDGVALAAPSNSFDTTVLCIDAMGVHVAETIPPVELPYFSILSYAYSSGVLYMSNGSAIDVATGSLAGNYPTQGQVVAETRVNRTFFLETGGVSAAAQILSFTLDSFTDAGIAGFSAPPNLNWGRLVRWGRYGFAYLSSGGFPPTPPAVAIVRTSLVPAGP